MTRFFLGFALVLAFEAAAGAQGYNANANAFVSFDPDNAVAPVSTVEGPGIKIGEGTVLHPVFGVETGYVSNVFYDSNDPKGAGVLRLLAQVGTGSLPDSRLFQVGADPAQGEDKGDFQYRADARLSYDFYFGSDSTVSDTGGLGIGASFHGLVNPMGRWSLGLDEDFTRLIRATNFETDVNTNRDVNGFGLKLLYHPSDSAFGGWLYYQNTIDVFEASGQTFADRMFNRAGIHATWQWLPQTQVYADVSEGIVNGIGTADGTTPKKITSYPLIAIAGLSTLFTLKTTFNVFAGYTNGFYSAGANFSAPTAGAALGYRYSPLGRVTLQYALQYQDSINANYYRDHVIQLSVMQRASQLMFMLQPEVHFREYNGVDIVQGPMTRDDKILAVVAGVHYVFRDWGEVTLDYRLTDVSSDYRYMPIGGGMVDDPSYVRHELLLGVRAAL